MIVVSLEVDRDDVGGRDLAERDVQWAVLASVLLERAVQMQSIAATLGPLRPIPGELLASIHERKYQADFPGEYWDAWVRELRTDEDIIHGLDGSICRCTGYRSILEAARDLAGIGS